MKKLNQNYFKVVAKCGHVGRCNYVPIIFAVAAENGKEASKRVRAFPRVKHDHKDAILKCNKITLEEFLQIKEINNNDPYLHSKSKHEQNMIRDLIYRLEEDHHHDKKTYSKEDRKQRVRYKLAKYKMLSDFVEMENEYDYVY